MSIAILFESSQRTESGSASTSFFFKVAQKVYVRFFDNIVSEINLHLILRPLFPRN